VGKPASGTLGAIHTAATGDCAACHVAGASFVPARFSAGTIPGGHASFAAGSCATCHVNGTTSKNTNVALPAGHSAISSSTDCSSCHSKTAWKPATAGAMPGDAVHLNSITTNCGTCHTRGYDRATSLQTFQHSLIKAGVDCSACHGGAVSGVRLKPIGGEVGALHSALTSCASCHRSTAAFAPQTIGNKPSGHSGFPLASCFACHNGRVTKGKERDHKTASDVCGSCHTTSSWGRVNNTPVAVTIPPPAPPQYAANRALQHTLVDTAKPSAGTASIVQASTNGTVSQATTGSGAQIAASTASGSMANNSASATPTSGGQTVPGMRSGKLGGSVADNGTILAPTGESTPRPGSPSGNADEGRDPRLKSVSPVSTTGNSIGAGNRIGNGLAEEQGANFRPNSPVTPAVPPIASGAGGSRPGSTPLGGISDRDQQGRPIGFGQPPGLPGNLNPGGRSVGPNGANREDDDGASPVRPSVAGPSSVPPVVRGVGVIPGAAGALGSGGIPVPQIPGSTTIQGAVTPATSRPDRDPVPGGRFTHQGVLPGACITCHNGGRAQGKPSKHLPVQLSCDSCHRTTVWRPVTFSHSTVMGTPCASCHNNNSATGKAGAHFVTAKGCESCHRTTGWKPTQSYAHTSAAYRMHRSSVSCKDCHKTNNETIAWPNGNFKPDCAGCHANDFKAKNHVKSDNPRTLYTVSELKDCTGSCHTYADAAYSKVKESRAGKHRPTGSFD